MDVSNYVSNYAANCVPSKTLGETRPSLSWDLKRLYYSADAAICASERSRDD